MSSFTTLTVETIMWYRIIKELQRPTFLVNFAGSFVLLALFVLGASEQAHLTRAGEPQPEPTWPIDEPFLPNPFPVTAAMTDTVQLALDQYLGRQRIVNPTFNDQDFISLNSRSTVYLPLIRRPVVSGGSTPTPRPRPSERADIAVTIWPEPSIYVTRGGRLVYDLRIFNYDQGSAENIRVILPFDRRQMRPIGSRLDRAKGDWVSRLTDREVEVTFGAIDGKASRTGQLMFEINTSLGNDTILDMRPSYIWQDGHGDEGPYTANWAPVLVGNGAATAPWVWTTVTPIRGVPGTIHTFLTNRFTPGEGIVTWLNTPSGVRALELRGVADSQGVVTLDFSSTGLKPGSYQLVLYGARSQLTGVASFTVQ
jgi:hypothetical protein